MRERILMSIQQATLIFAILIGMADSTEEQVDESPSIAKIELLGGKVTRDETLLARPVIEIDLRGSQRFRDGHVQILKQFPHLKTLTLEELNVTDQGLIELGKLTQLIKLNLFGTEVTDAGMNHIGKLTELRTLQLGKTRITDAGLKELRGLTALKTLGLWKTGITDQGLKEIGEFKELKTLYLGKTAITNEGLKQLTGLKKLRILYVEDTRVTYDGVMTLREELPELDTPILLFDAPTLRGKPPGGGITPEFRQQFRKVPEPKD
jgi:hypothetical protein